MDKMHYEEMVRNLDDLEKEALLKEKGGFDEKGGPLVN